MGSDIQLEGEEIEIKIDDIIEHLANTAIADGLNPELLRESAMHFFTDMFKNIGEGDAKLAKAAIAELADKLEKRMREMDTNVPRET